MKRTSLIVTVTVLIWCVVFSTISTASFAHASRGIKPGIIPYPIDPAKEPIAAALVKDSIWTKEQHDEDVIISAHKQNRHEYDLIKGRSSVMIMSVEYGLVLKIFDDGGKLVETTDEAESPYGMHSWWAEFDVPRSATYSIVVVNPTNRDLKYTIDVFNHLSGHGRSFHSINLDAHGTYEFQLDVETDIDAPFYVEKGDKISVVATGKIMIGPFAGYSTPDGVSGYQAYSYFGNVPHASLLVKNGDQQWSLCGSHCSFVALESKSLKFMVNDKDYSNNSGAYHVVLSVQRAVKRTSTLSPKSAASPVRIPRPTMSNRGPISGGVLNGKAISLPLPTYPAKARSAHASGTVVVQVLVDEEGNVVSAHAVSGHLLLQSVAVEAARQAKFTPTKLDGEPVKVNGTLTYTFVAR